MQLAYRRFRFHANMTYVFRFLLVRANVPICRFLDPLLLSRSEKVSEFVLGKKKEAQC